MTETEKAKHIRCMVTAAAIANYQLLKLVDNTHHELKQKVRFAIKSYSAIENYFTLHDEASSETKQTFKEQFLGDEIVLLSELLETCFGISPDGLEEIIKAIKNNVEVTA